MYTRFDMAFLPLLTTLCFVCCTSLAAVAVVSGPDAQSGTASLSLDGGLSASSSNTSSSAPSSASAPVSTAMPIPPPLPPARPSTVPPVTAPPPVMDQASYSMMSSPGISSPQSQGSVPFDIKSMDNPYFVSFLEDFARQSGKSLQELQGTAVTDPHIGILWDVYVQTFGGGATLPVLDGAGSGGSSSSYSTSGGGSSSSYSTSGGGSSSSYSTSGGGSSSSYSTSGGGSSSSYSTSGGSAATQYSGGSQQGGASSSDPVLNGNWFQSFFKQTTPSPPSSSYSRYSPSQSQYGSNPSSAVNSMDQMLSSFFRLPSSSQPSTQQQYGQYSQQNALRPGMTGMDVAQGLMSVMSPGTRQSSTAQASRQQQYSPQSGQYVQSGQTGSLPSSKSPSPQQSSESQNSFSNATVEQLSNELLMLLGKLPSTPPPTSSTTTTTPSPPVQTQPPERSTRVNPVTAAPPQSQVQTVTSAPASAIFNSQFANAPTNQMQAASNFGGLSSLTNFGGPSASLGLPGQPGPQLHSVDALSRMNMLNPLTQFYNARYDAKASRDLGCRTLGEMLDMDVPRTMDLTCRRSCAAIMPGAVIGKRFFLTCHCCPVYVSDRAIGMRSMYWRAEALS